ncbi:type II toxin-antitoxin system death-on-curing family toxin [Candidatus Enterococcus moelleringii]|nr:type II toxin-antitoxin system death-on-curing family toxin [Enterococcus sp. 669A]
MVMKMNHLSEETIIKLNVLAITTFSPKEQIGVKDAPALHMCVNQPQQEVFGEELYPTVYEKAGILYINIATKHAFFNANKRTAWLAMDVFLKANGYQTDFTTEEGLDFTLNVVNYEKDFDTLKEYVFTYLKTTDKIQPK